MIRFQEKLIRLFRGPLGQFFPQTLILWLSRKTNDESLKSLLLLLMVIQTHFDTEQRKRKCIGEDTTSRSLSSCCSFNNAQIVATTTIVDSTGQQFMLMPINAGLTPTAQFSLESGPPMLPAGLRDLDSYVEEEGLYAFKGDRLNTQVFLMLIV